MFSFQPMPPPRRPVAKGMRRMRAASQLARTERRLVRRLNLQLSVQTAAHRFTARAASMKIRAAKFQ